MRNKNSRQQPKGILASLVEALNKPLFKKEIGMFMQFFENSSKNSPLNEPLIGRLSRGAQRQLAVNGIDLRFKESTLIEGELRMGAEVQVLFKEKGRPESGVRSLRVLNQWRDKIFAGQR